MGAYNKEVNKGTTNMTSVTSTDKARYGSSTDRVNSFDDSLEIEAIIPVLLHHHPEAQVIEKPYGEYGIDVVVRENGQDIIWIELERSFGWNGRFRYNSASFLERKAHFIEEAKAKGAQFRMVWFESNHRQFLWADGETISEYVPFTKTLNSGREERVRHIDIGQCNFYTM